VSGGAKTRFASDEDERPVGWDDWTVTCLDAQFRCVDAGELEDVMLSSGQSHLDKYRSGCPGSGLEFAFRTNDRLGSRLGASDIR
jgi:hypothetical protein